MTEKNSSIQDQYLSLVKSFQSLDITKDMDEQCFDLIHATSKFSDFISTGSGFLQSQLAPGEINIFDLIESFTNFFTVDILLPDQQTSLLMAFLPLFQSVLVKISSSGIFTPSEYDAAWKYFQKEFIKCTQALMPFQFRPLISELLSQCEAIKPVSMKIPDIIQNLHVSLSGFVQRVEFDAKSEIYSNTLNDIVRTRQEIFKIIRAEKGKEWNQTILPPFVTAFKNVEDYTLFSYRFAKLKETMQLLSNSQKLMHFPPVTRQQMARPMLVGATKMMQILLRNLVSFPMDDTDQAWLSKNFDIINSILISLKIHNDVAVKEKWDILIKAMNPKFFNKHAAREQDLIEKLTTISSSFCINYPRMSQDVAEIQSLYNNICSSAKNVYSLLSLYVILSQSAQNSVNTDFTTTVLMFRRLITFRIFYTCCVLTAERCTLIVQILPSLDSKSDVYRTVKILKSANEQLKTVGMDFQPSNEYFISRYEAYLTFLVYLSRVKDNDQQLQYLLKYHPSSEYFCKIMTPKEDVGALISDIRFRADNAPLFAQANKLKNYKVGSLQWIESAALFFQYSLGRTLDIRDICNTYDGYTDILRVIDRINTEYSKTIGCVKNVRTSNDGLIKYINAVDSAIGLLKDPAYKTDKSAMINAAAQLNLHLMFSDAFSENEANSMLNDLMATVNIPVKTDVIKYVYGLLDKVEAFRVVYPSDIEQVFTDMRNLFNSMLFGNFPDVDVIKSKMTTLIGIVRQQDKLMAEGIKSDEDLILSHLENCLLLFKFMKNHYDVNEQRVLRMAFNHNILKTLAKEAKALIAANLIFADKVNDVKSKIDETEQMTNNNAFQFWTDYESTGKSQELITQWKSMENFVDHKRLYVEFSQIVPLLKSITTNSSIFNDSEYDNTVDKIEVCLREFSFVPSRIALFNIERRLNLLSSTIRNKQKSTLGQNMSIDAFVYRRKIMKIIDKISSVRFIIDFFEHPIATSNDTTFMKLVADFQAYNSKIDQNDIGYQVLTLPRTAYLLSLAETLTPEQVAEAHFNQAKRVNQSMKDEIEKTTKAINQYPETIKKKIADAQAEVDRFEEHMKEAQDKQDLAKKVVDDLRKRRDELNQELEKLKKNQGDSDSSVPHFDTEMSSVISLLLRDEEFCQPRTEADFIAEQLQEALRTNLRLKKSIEVLGFPHEKAVFTPSEFAQVLGRFSAPTTKVSPFTTQRANESAALRQQLRDLHTERDNLFRQIVKETQKTGYSERKRYNTDSLYQHMKSLNTRGIVEGASRKNQKEQFLEFADVSDQFLLEVSHEIKDLEQEISDLEEGKNIELLDMETHNDMLRKKLSTQLSPAKEGNTE